MDHLFHSVLASMQETAPLNLDGLQSLCSALTTAALQEADDPLSVNEYLKVGDIPRSSSAPASAHAMHRCISSCKGLTLCCPACRIGRQHEAHNDLNISVENCACTTVSHTSP